MAPITDATRYAIIQAVLNREPQVTRRLKLLVLTRCQGIVTTNFDGSLLKARAETRSSWVVYGEADQDLAAARVATHPFFVRLHGRIEVPEGMVFAERHYRALAERAQYDEFFRDLFLNRNLIFFGFSFVDPVISRLIADMSRAVRSSLSA